MSEGLEILDFDLDAEEIFPRWMDIVRSECPGLVDKFCIVKTPSGGFHISFRSRKAEGNQKLAQREVNGVLKVLIETRGEGGYAIAPPSPPECHPLRKSYEVISGDLTNIPTVSTQEREKLIKAAISLNEYAKNEEPAIFTADLGDRPGDEYNARGDWDQLLIRNGWVKVRDSGEVSFWRRPGKDQGHSATLNYRGRKLLHVFSTDAAPLEANKSYKLFSAYAYLEHNGDFRAAAAALVEQGYGKEEANNTRRLSQATQLVELATRFKLFATKNNEAYATLAVTDHYENWPIRSREFSLLLRHYFYKEYRVAPNRQSLEEAISQLESKALFDSERKETHIRIAQHNGNIYLDLANEKWEAIEITNEGYRIISKPPVIFRRTKGMQPLPYPSDNGSVEDLLPFLNLESKDDELLLTGWIICAFIPDRPFAPLSITGEQGSAKSTITKILKALVDPHSVPLRSVPRNERDLMIAANNNHILAFDNLSGISREMSDALCRLATGGGFSTRELYSDSDEALFEAKRPIILNGIDELATKEDLVDRYLPIKTAAISSNRRKRESELWKDFEAARPGILGALLSLVTKALKYEQLVSISKLPRMADFVTLATAALGEDFLNAYWRNREKATALVLEASPLASAIIDFMEKRKDWGGTPKQLLDILEEEVTINIRLHHYDWPKDPSWLSRKLNRIASNLRGVGILIKMSKSGKRNIHLEKIDSVNSVDSKDGTIVNAAPSKVHGAIDLDTKDGKDSSSLVFSKREGVNIEQSGKEPSPTGTGELPPIVPLASNSFSTKNYSRASVKELDAQDDRDDKNSSEFQRFLEQLRSHNGSAESSPKKEYLIKSKKKLVLPDKNKVKNLRTKRMLMSHLPSDGNEKSNKNEPSKNSDFSLLRRDEKDDEAA